MNVSKRVVELKGKSEAVQNGPLIQEIFCFAESRAKRDRVVQEVAKEI